MGFDNPIHIAFVLIIVLLVFGAKRLPELGRSMGSGMRGFRDALTGDSPAQPLTALEQAPLPVAAVAPAVQTQLAVHEPAIDAQLIDA